MALFNKNFIADKPIIENYKDVDLHIKPPKFKGYNTKPFPFIKSSYKAHVIKPFPKSHVNLHDHLHVKNFKTIKDKGGNYFLDEYGVLNKKT